ncbi:glycosyltransferase family 61 protein [Hymenobacter lucidus]|uniref:Glycosyltransferase family 61 protein n=1 Tax=Hymenobacter lucidus TaxID=2880930 RepID=A0ABS8AP65_9BACT|nr:glycosyltransferase family 61 protein [Hymenobacter lucidus]MCB2408000.1 glycosyltransferase family 61 protein [Hymenobacter lucidus]
MHDLLARAQRRAGRVLRELIPYHRHLRPLGTHAVSRQLAANASGATYTEIYPAYESYLQVPEVFQTCGPSYYEPVAAQEHMPAAFVLTLENGRINVDDINSVAIIAADNQLVGDVSLQFSPTTFALAPPAEHPIFRQSYFQPPREIAGTVCSLLSGGGAAIGNYYHWLLDSLPRLHLVQEAGLWESIDYFLIYDRNHRFAVETLRELGIRDEQIIDVQGNTHLRAERLVVTSSVRGGGRHAPRWVGEFMRQAFLPPSSGSSRPFSSLVYVTRRDASFRQVRNEAEVEELLAGYGFESYALSELSLREKVALFSGARAVVGPVGAGLVNIVFCQPGTPLIEFLPRNLIVADYLDLTSRLDMPHYPLISRRDDASAQSANADRRDDLTVDIKVLRRTLQQALPEAVPA